MAVKLKEAELICNDVFGIQARLFNHQAVMKSECKFMVREFETKKNNEHSKSFLEMTLATGKVKQRIPECVTMVDERSETLHQKVVNAASKGMDILNKEHTGIKELRESLKGERDKNAEEFLDEMNNAKNEILKKHEISMNELANELN